MNIVVCFTCLLAVAVTAGVTAVPEQQLANEEHLAYFEDDHLERNDFVCKAPCTENGGNCFHVSEDCPGDKYRGRKFCRGKGCRCCVPFNPAFAADTCTKTSLATNVIKCAGKSAILCIIGDSETCWTLIKTCVNDVCFPEDR